MATQDAEKTQNNEGGATGSTKKVKGKGSKKKRYEPLNVEYLNYSYSKEPTHAASSLADIVRKHKGNYGSNSAPTVYAPQPVRNDNLAWAARMSRPASKPEPYIAKFASKPYIAKSPNPSKTALDTPSTGTKELEHPRDLELCATVLSDASTFASPKRKLSEEHEDLNEAASCKSEAAQMENSFLSARNDSVNWYTMHDECDTWAPPGNVATAQTVAGQQESAEPQTPPAPAYTIIEPTRTKDSDAWKPTISRLVIHQDLVDLSIRTRRLTSSEFDATYGSSRTRMELYGPAPNSNPISSDYRTRRGRGGRSFETEESYRDVEGFSDTAYPSWPCAECQRCVSDGQYYRSQGWDQWYCHGCYNLPAGSSSGRRKSLPKDSWKKNSDLAEKSDRYTAVSSDVTVGDGSFYPDGTTGRSQQRRSKKTQGTYVKKV